MVVNGILVVDSIMGSGKTLGMFDYMSKHPNKKYLYISPLLSEVGDGNKNQMGRIQEVLPELDFIPPKNVGKGKLDTVKKLVRNGSNISSTHELFKQFDTEIVDLLIDNQYVLVIDEAVDCIKQFGGVSKEDIDILITSGAISVDKDTGRVDWVDGVYDGKHKYEQVRELSKLGNLFRYEDQILIWEYPDRLLKELPEVYIMTYLFQGSVMYSWLLINEIPWLYADLDMFNLKSSASIKREIRDKIEFVGSRNLNKLRKDRSFNLRYFTYTRYMEATASELREVKKLFESVVKRTGAKAGDVFWTTYKGVKDGEDILSSKQIDDTEHIRKAVEGQGFTRGKNDLSPFLPYNTKATNDYQDHWLVMYGVNLNKKPMEQGYIGKRCDIKFDNDIYALSEMLQFVWRSRIRKGEPIKLFILSERMERLFKEWLYSGV